MSWQRLPNATFESSASRWSISTQSMGLRDLMMSAPVTVLVERVAGPEVDGPSDPALPVRRRAGGGIAGRSIEGRRGRAKEKPAQLQCAVS
jgi:hypothetical protein